MSLVAGQEETQKVAIIGMGCRFPGDAGSPEAFWRLLAERRDAVRERPAGRPELWAADANGGNTAADGKPELRYGGFLPDVTGFDADFFGVPGREAALIDPQHRLLLQVAWEALEHAGLPPDQLAGTSTGVFTGLSYTEYMERLAGQPGELEGAALANGPCVAGGRISYLLGLNGPCMVLDTACSSSLVALHLACQALRAGECDIAIAGGVSLVLSPRMSLSFARMGMLSPTGRCHAFDAAADGFVRGEGCGVVVLKRAADAMAAGDRTLALVRGSAVNQDGRSDGLAAPSAAAQRALFEEALARAGVDPGDVGMIEAHGTGTPVGDPVEFASLTAVYGAGRERCALTSVKTNLGHLEPAAGISGLIKAVLSLQRGLIPPNLHFSGWNPEFAADGTRFFVPTALTSWPSTAPSRLAAVSSFGFSGTNAHVLLEQAPRRGAAAASAAAAGRPASPGPSHDAHPGSSAAPEAFVVPAGSKDVLPDAARRLAAWLEAEGAAVPLRHIAYTQAVRRSHGRGRLGVVARSHDELIGGLRAFAAGQAYPGVVSGAAGAGISRPTVWVFSGQGSQWTGMGRGLLRHDAAFAAALAEVDRLIASEAGFSVLEIVRDGQPVSACAQVQPVLFAMQFALAAAWRAHGVEPAGVVGHSMGEVAAAVVAGALTVADGVAVICRRSALLARVAGDGAMASVALDPGAAESELVGAGLSESVSVAVLAAPGSTVVAGDPAQVARLVGGWEKRGIPARLIAVDVASHSPHVDPLLDDLAAALTDLEPRQPDIPFYSTVLADPREAPEFDAAYWCANLRRPVRFAAAIAAAAADRRSVYVEVSPHPVVTRAISDSLAGLAIDPVIVPTLRRDEDDLGTFRTQLAALHCAGVAIDWSAVYPSGELAEVPPITLDAKRHWVDVIAHPAPAADSPALPGEHARVPGERLRHSWRGDVGTAAIGWLADHLVHGHPVLPGAVYSALALTAGCEALAAPADEIEVTGLAFRELLRLDENTEVTTTLTMTAADRGECEIYGPDGADGWTRLASAVLRRVDRAPSAGGSASPPDGSSLGSPAGLYAGMRARGIDHGPAFAGITGLGPPSEGRTCYASVQVPASAAAPHGLRVHPVLLDICTQTLMTLLPAAAGSGLILPTGIKRMRIFGDPDTAAFCQARIVEQSADGVTGQVLLLDPAGATLISLDGIQLSYSAEEAAVDRWFLEPTWQPSPSATAQPAEPAGQWLVCGAAAGAAEALAKTLQSAGATAEVVDVPAEDAPLGELGGSLAGQWADRPAPRAVVLLAVPDAAGDDPVSEEAAAQALVGTRRLLGAAQAVAAAWADPPRLYVVTRGAQPIHAGDPVSLGQGAARGLVRVLACEHPRMRPTQLDVDPADGSYADLAAELLADHPEEEVALRAGSRHVAQLAYAPVTVAERAAVATRTVRYGEDGFRLRAGRLGELSALELVTAPRRRPGPDEVELRVQAAGLNFRDVLTVMGLLGTDDGARYRIGFECAGVVTATGPGVSHLRAGDLVLAIDLRGGAFGSFVTLPATAVSRIPAGLTPEAAAGIPAVFMTAWYGLRHLARLEPGERVLIHSATGGTGMAAVAVARLLGGEVLATAGSEEKRRQLREMGITHVMDSRSLDFAEQARAATDGEGVDVVLNSLTGPAIRAGLEVLRPFGRFIELGVRDILADAPLGMQALRHNITLSTVDLIELQRTRPDAFAKVLEEVLSEFAAGRLKPTPHRAFPLAEAADAFTLMAGAGHIGKLVLTVPDEGQSTAVLSDEHPARPDGAYIVTGGLSGVGLATARWLALGGAAHVVVNGRTAPSAAAERTLAEMRTAGSRVTVELGDIAEPGTAERLVTQATRDGLPLRGIVHSAMVLDDGVITNVTDSQLGRVWQPKVTGAWRLHQAAAGHDLDWLVLYSSMASLLGNPGQGAYAAANSWLDSFAAWRTARGLRTLAVNWGPWGETGAATDFAARGYETVPTDDGLRALGTLLAHRRVRVGVIPGDPETWVPHSVRDSSLLCSLFDGRPASGPLQPQAGDTSILTTLDAAEPGLARRLALEAYVAEQIRGVLRLDNATLDPETPLRSLGFDSLLSMELGARLESGLAIKLPAKFVWTHPTLAALADGIADQMKLAEVHQ
jgi:phthioceranic/hydroxyphthioceranic acid synthase